MMQDGSSHNNANAGLGDVPLVPECHRSEAASSRNATTGDKMTKPIAIFGQKEEFIFQVLSSFHVYAIHPVWAWLRQYKNREPFWTQLASVWLIMLQEPCVYLFGGIFWD